MKEERISTGPVFQTFISTDPDKTSRPSDDEKEKLVTALEELQESVDTDMEIGHLETTPVYSFPVEKEQIKAEEAVPNISNYELPLGYGDNRVVLLVRDPYWLFAYWEINDEVKNNIRNSIGSEAFDQCQQTLRVLELGENTNSGWFDIPINGYASNWFINVPKDDTGYVVEVGFRTPWNQFIVAARSNLVHTPPSGISDILDEEWLALDEDFFKLYRLGNALSLSGSEELIKGARGLAVHLEREMASGAISSLFSPIGQKPGVPGNFWLKVDAEVILYGQTEPDAYVTMGGQPMTLREDGSFSARFALPDGRFEFPVEAISHCGSYKIVITPEIKRSTH